MDHHVRPRQVQSGAARLQGNAEHRRIILIEASGHLHAPFFGCTAGQQIIADPLLLKPAGNPGQHGGELGEQQDLVAALHRVFHQIHAQLQLRGAAPVILIFQGRVTAQKPQPGQLRQDLNPGGIELLLRLPRQLHPQSLGMGLIQFPLLPFQPGRHLLLNFVRQFPQHLLFAPAENEGRNHLSQPLHGIFILILHDGQLQLTAEPLIPIEKSRHHIVKDTPELAEPVLQRRSRKSQPEFCLYRLHRVGRLGPLILDVLGFIDDLTAEWMAFIPCDISAEQIIGGDQHIPLLLL